MSEDDKQPPKPPTPMKKTSAVPLKKETVRVTLKATPESGEAPKPPAPTAARQGDSPPAPAPTIPLRTAGPPAPTTSRPAAPAPTVQLRAPGAGIAPKTTPLKTQPLSSPAGTQALPKATVQLGSATQALGAPTALSVKTGATIHAAVEDEEESSDTLPNVLSIVAFVVALAVLGLQLMTSLKWTDVADPVEGKGFSQLFE